MLYVHINYNNNNNNNNNFIWYGEGGVTGAGRFQVNVQQR